MSSSVDISGSSDFIFETILVVCFLEYPRTSNAEIAYSLSLWISDGAIEFIATSLMEFQVFIKI